MHITVFANAYTHKVMPCTDVYVSVYVFFLCTVVQQLLSLGCLRSQESSMSQ